jgi:hypothetical protein
VIESVERPWVAEHVVESRPSGLLVATPGGADLERPWVLNWWLDKRPSGLVVAFSEPPMWAFLNSYSAQIGPAKDVSWTAWDQQVTTNSNGGVWGKPVLSDVLNAMEKIKEQIGEPSFISEDLWKVMSEPMPITVSPIDSPDNTSIASEYFKKIAENLGVPYRIFNPPYHVDKPDWITEAGWWEIVDGELEFERRLARTAAGRWAAEVDG